MHAVLLICQSSGLHQVEFLTPSARNCQLLGIICVVTTITKKFADNYSSIHLVIPGALCFPLTTDWICARSICCWVGCCFLRRLWWGSAFDLQAKFRILQQKYIELLGSGQANAALETLRNQIAPLQINFKEVKRLSGVAFPHPAWM